MPFRPVPCEIWLPIEGERDDFGNAPATFAEQPDIETTCCYAPGGQSPDTDQDIDIDRPGGDVLRMTFFLPKSMVSSDLRGAQIACLPPDDPWLSGRRFDVEGAPVSYPRGNTPGDYSWEVKGVAHLG